MKTIIVTGANSGLGFETTKQLVASHLDYQVVMACRNLSKATAARAEILEAQPDAQILCLPLDTLSLIHI